MPSSKRFLFLFLLGVASLTSCKRDSEPRPDQGPTQEISVDVEGLTLSLPIAVAATRLDETYTTGPETLFVIAPSVDTDAEFTLRILRREFSSLDEALANARTRNAGEPTADGLHGLADVSPAHGYNLRLLYLAEPPAGDGRFTFVFLFQSGGRKGKSFAEASELYTSAIELTRAIVRQASGG